MLRNYTSSFSDTEMIFLNFMNVKMGIFTPTPKNRNDNTYVIKIICFGIRK